MDIQTLQTQLIDIVESVIGTRVQPDEYMESLFDSMSKVQLMVEVKDRLGVTLPVDEIDALVDSGSAELDALTTNVYDVPPASPVAVHVGMSASLFPQSKISLPSIVTV